MRMMPLQKREIAKRVFAYELSKSTYMTSESGDRMPKYVLTPTGARCNRVFFVGVLLDKEEVRPDSNFWRIRISDPTGVITGFIGRYQADALESLLEIQPPELIAVVAKLNIFEGETRSFISLRPEAISVVDSETRDFWVVETARRTVERLKNMLDDCDEDCQLAKEVYNTDVEEYLQTVKNALLAIKEEVEVFSDLDKTEAVSETELVDEAKVTKKVTEVEVQEEDISDIEPDIDLDDFEFEEEEWDLSDLLEEEE
jgi:RPA family protein